MSSKQNFKCVVIGDSSVGKTSLLKSYATHKFAKEHKSTVFDNYILEVMVSGKLCQVGLYDTSSELEDNIRPMSYVQSDIILLCFSVVEPDSFKSIQDRWIQELHFHAPRTPFILVGTQIDRRNDIQASIHGKKSKANFSTVKLKQGQKLAKELEKYSNCIGYVECSALTQFGLKEVFDEAIATATTRYSPLKKSKKGKCYTV